MQPLKNYFKRILVVRTDRIGDVLLSTPALKALRDNYPAAHIAIMVSPQTQDIVEGNPYINEVIVYDKEKKDKGFRGFWKFVAGLKKKKFDLAVILHTKKRTNLIAYLADIPRRVGYKDKKFSFLLTDKIEDTRPKGLKHEVDYCLDVLRALGMKAEDRRLYMPLKAESLEWADKVLKEKGINQNDKCALLHPGASCVSKRWMKERFVELANNLVEGYGFKVILVAGIKDIKIARDIEKALRYPLVNLAGEISLAQLAAVIKRGAIFISNDSGPVHIASALGVPVISIFGRSQAGLSPVRWGPLGESGKYIHKKVGCQICLAHDCKRSFACLKAVTVRDVLEVVDTFIKKKGSE